MQKLLHGLKVAPENYGLLGAVYFSFFMNGLTTVMLGTLLPFIRAENGLSYSQSGLMLSAHQFGNLTAVLLAGVLPYLIGRKQSTLTLLTGTIIGMMLMVATENPWLFVAAFAFTGIGRGTLSNTCNVAIAEVSGNKTGALNILHAIFAIGALLSPVVVFAFTGVLHTGWKGAAVTVAVLALTAWLLLARSNLSATPTKKEGGGALTFLQTGNFWVSTMILFFYLCAEASIIGWFVIYFKEVGALPARLAEFTPTLLWSMIMLGRVMCAAISAKVNKNRLLFALGAAFALFFTGMLLSPTPAVCVACLLGIGFSMAGIYPTTLSTMKASASGIATGFAMAIASVGAILMPGIVGAVADSQGLKGGVSVILASLLLMIVLIVAQGAMLKHRAAGSAGDAAAEQAGKRKM